MLILNKQEKKWGSMLHQTKTSLRVDKILLNSEILNVPLLTIPKLPNLHSESQDQQNRKTLSRKRNKISKQSRKKNRKK